MSKQSASKRNTNLRPVGESAPAVDVKIKRERKSRPKVHFADDLRELAASHRKRIGSLVDAEAKLETKLAEVRAQREAAEGPLREVEALLERHPVLPLEQPEAEPPMHADAAGEAVPA